MDFLWKDFFSKHDLKKTIRDTLKEIYIFNPLSSSELKLVENIVNVRHYQPGELIFKQGEMGVGMYIVLTGSVQIASEEFNIDLKEPRSTEVVIIRPGEFFGELALIENTGRRSATAIAKQECSLIGFYKPDLMEIIDRNPGAGVKILLRLAEVIGDRLIKTTSKLRETQL